MKNKTKAPEKLESATKPTPRALNSESELRKDIKNILNPSRKKVLNIFLSGEKVSNVDITFRLGLSDPRSAIRDIRKSGYLIADFWVETELSRHKIYFLHTGEATTEYSNNGVRHEKE